MIIFMGLQEKMLDKMPFICYSFIEKKGLSKSLNKVKKTIPATVVAVAFSFF